MRKNYRMLNELLATYRAKPVTLLAITEVRDLPKEHPLKGHLYRKTLTNGFVRINYERHVRKVTGDPSFVAGERLWGHHVWSNVVAEVRGEKRRLSALIAHIRDGQERYYIDFMEMKRLSVEYIDINGKHVDFDPADLVTRKEVVRVRNYDLMNILEIRINGTIIRPN